jgi:hypothetical protein
MENMIINSLWIMKTKCMISHLTLHLPRCIPACYETLACVTMLGV